MPNVTVKKLTVKTLGITPDDVKDVTKYPSGVMHAGIIAGQAIDLKEVEDVNNPGQKLYGLKGAFTGQNLITGEQYEAGTCYLPTIAMDIVAPLVSESIKKAADENGNYRAADVNPITFAFLIRVVADLNNARNARKYQYQVINMVKPKENDPMAELKAEIQATLSGMTIEAHPAIAAGKPVEAQKQIEAPKTHTHQSSGETNQAPRAAKGK